MTRLIILLALCLPVISVSQAPTPPAHPRDARITAVIDLDAAAPASTGWKQTMDFYPPAGPGPHPAVIIVHGGGFTSGTSRNGSEAYCADFLAPAGYAVFSINYRLAPPANFADMIFDVQRSIRFIRYNAAKYGVDPGKIVLLGGSAGGYLSNMVGLLPPAPSTSSRLPFETASDQLAAVVTLYGIADLATMPHPEEFTAKHLLNTASPSSEDLASASPITHVRTGAPPFLFIHGDHDESVPFQQSVTLQAALRRAGDRADLIAIPGGIHGTWTWHALPNVPDWERQTVEWLNTILHHTGPIGEGIEARTPPPAHTK